MPLRTRAAESPTQQAPPRVLAAAGRTVSAKLRRSLSPPSANKSAAGQSELPPLRANIDTARRSRVQPSAQLGRSSVRSASVAPGMRPTLHSDSPRLQAADVMMPRLGGSPRRCTSADGSHHQVSARCCKMNPQHSTANVIKPSTDRRFAADANASQHLCTSRPGQRISRELDLLCVVPTDQGVCHNRSDSSRCRVRLEPAEADGQGDIPLEGCSKAAAGAGGKAASPLQAA